MNPGSKKEAYENKDSLYLYLLIATKLSDFETLNRLLNNEDFIKTIDTTKIDGSMIITLTNNCNKPRTLLLTKSTKIKKCLLNGDDLFDSEEILSNLTKEEVKLLHQDLSISNFLITNGYRFDVLKEEVEEKIFTLKAKQKYTLEEINHAYQYINHLQKMIQ